MPRLLLRLGVVTAVAVTLIAGGGSMAVAHVSVHADEAVQGGSAELAFRVPTESDIASTVTVQVALPVDTPIAHVAVLPLAGWTYQVTKAASPTPVEAGHGTTVSEVVSQIEWRATSPETAVKPGEYQVFRVAAAPLPETDRLVFKVVQTYTDGQVQRWIEDSVPGEPESEHPAPVLALDPAAGATEHSHDAVSTVGSSTPAPPSQSSATVIIAVTALLVALGAAFMSLRLARRRGGDESPA
jgi:periplasmic copper chaperone A